MRKKRQEKEKERRQINFWPDTNELTKPARKVARMLNVHPNTLFGWVKAGKIECIRYNCRTMYFTYDQVLDYLNQNRERVILRIWEDLQ